MKNIFWGLAIIAIGLIRGNSVFFGNFSLLTFFFDGLGLFWLGKGAWALYNRNSGADPAA
jgi:hypothetical protein